jgi:hypothetical protein
MNKKESDSRLAKVTLNFYAFHLRNELGQGDLADKNANLIWGWCESLSEELEIEKLEGFKNKLRKQNNEIGLPPTQDYPDSNYLELLEEGLIDFSIQNSQNKIHGAVYPLQIHDVFSLNISLNTNSNTINIADLNQLNPKDFSLPENIKSFLKDNFLGQTLLLFAQPVDTTKDYQILAKECLKALVPEIEIKKDLSSGCFFGSPIFEYDNGQEKPGKNIHILIWFNSVFVTEHLVAEELYYQPLIYLLCFRSKILFAYSESRQSYQKAKKLYQKLKDTVENIKELPKESNERLQEFNNILKKLSFEAFDYTRHLRDLEIQHATIITNCKNYKTVFQELQKISLKGRDNLQFLQEFLNHARNNFAEQIKVDLSYLNTGRELYSEIINSIRGIVEIEQAELEAEKVERSKSLERNIQVAGIALGFGAIAAASISAHIDKPFKPLNSKYPFHPMISSMFWSILVTAIFVFLMRALTKRKLKS